MVTALYMGDERSDLEAGLLDRAIGFQILDANDKVPMVPWIMAWETSMRCS